MTSLKEAMEYGIPFSFIITFATFCDANDALLEKSNWFLCLAWQCVRPVYCFASRKQNSIWNLERYVRNTSSLDMDVFVEKKSLCFPFGIIQTTRRTFCFNAFE